MEQGTRRKPLPHIPVTLGHHAFYLLKKEDYPSLYFLYENSNILDGKNYFTYISHLFYKNSVSPIESRNILNFISF